MVILSPEKQAKKQSVVKNLKRAGYTAVKGKFGAVECLEKNYPLSVQKRKGLRNLKN